MRLMTWNVNGIKTLPQYHPWNATKTYEGLLQALEADVICVQETKVTQPQITRDLAVLPSYDSFFSSYCRKPPRGYSGTAIFTKKPTCVPVKAEEGLGGTLQVAQKIPPEEYVGSYPSLSNLDLTPDELVELDLEGRATIVDLRLFVLINLYCPNQTNEVRLTYKQNFNALLAARVDALIRAGREVIVVGDINICAQAIDHAEPEKRAKDHGLEDFGDHPSRVWFNRWLGRDRNVKGTLIDVTRHFHPDRKKMFTCWETKIDARSSNFGTRLDYILVTPSLMPWIKHSDIQANIHGSDHCPVYADFHSSITTPDGRTLHLWQEINPLGRKKDADPPLPPRFAARNYDEFSGKQKLLSSFFGKKPPATSSTTTSAPPAPTPTGDIPAATEVGEASISSAMQALRDLPPESEMSPPLPTPSIEASFAQSIDDDFTPTSSATASAPAAGPSQPLSILRRPSSSEPSFMSFKAASKLGKNGPTAVKGNKKPVNGQSTLQGFFKPPAKPTPPQTGHPKKKQKGKGRADEVVQVEDDDELDAPIGSTFDERADYTAAVEAAMAGAAGGDYNAEASAKWSALLAPKAAPRCSMHNEVCKEFTVNKPGPNKGRRFWLCSRPVGPGSESKAGGDKAHSDPQWRCDFFQWQTGVKRPNDFGGERIKKAPIKKQATGSHGTMDGGKHGHG